MFGTRNAGLLFAAAAAIFAAAPMAGAPSAVTLCFDGGVPQVRFAAGEIRHALASKGAAIIERGLDVLRPAAKGARIVLVSGADEGRRVATALAVAPLTATDPQAYAVRKSEAGGHTAYVILGAGASGAMYGGLDLAEAIRLGTLAGIGEAEHVPHIARRGIKFNIPLDARTELLRCRSSGQVASP